MKYKPGDIVLLLDGIVIILAIFSGSNPLYYYAIADRYYLGDSPTFKDYRSFQSFLQDKGSKYLIVSKKIFNKYKHAAVLSTFREDLIMKKLSIKDKNVVLLEKDYT